ncbi:MAG TPA: tetratricopeptide repeat protein [Gemmatimonadaceae bacterium]|nr:tetratricopeptide repeat protein [Gemmatimonadaceae bacterium]
MRHLHSALLAVTLLGGSAAAWFLPGTSSVRADVSDVAAAGVLRRQEIAFYGQRLHEDPHSALDMAQLASLQMEEGRMTGDERAFVRAESLARKSLGERTKRNGRSASLLVNALLAQHRFGEATVVARELVSFDPEIPAYRALLAEVLMEIGDYDQAIGMLGSVRAHRAELGIAPRFARWAELTGQVAEARRILGEARDEAYKRPDLTAEQRAWFSVRLADFELRHGHVRAASAAINRGMREAPDDWRLVLARARVESALSSWRAAIASADQIIANVPSPDALALLADAHAALGQDEEAASFRIALEGIAQRKNGQMHRSWALSLLDAGSHADTIVVLAAADTLVRRDVHTLDLLAWALHRSNRSAEALPIMRRAMKLGGREPAMRYHAGLIELAAGNRAAARGHLEIALRGRHALTPLQVTEARRAFADARR